MISLSTAKAFMMGFFVAFGWTLGSWMTKTAISYWIELLKPLTIVKGIQF